MRVHVSAIGLLGPGFNNWASGKAILDGTNDYHSLPVALTPSALLPAAERRRTTDAVKLAMMVASEATSAFRYKAADLPSVFTSSGSDGATITAILEILTTPGRQVSPTRFHNSVHNAAAGYWSIATQSREASTSLCGYDLSFSVGILDAASQVVMNNKAILLVSYDLPYPTPLHAARPIAGMFGVAMVLAPQPTENDLATLDININFQSIGIAATPMVDCALEFLRQNNPSARSLPLLTAIALSAQREIALEYIAGHQLTIVVNAVRCSGGDVK